MGSQCPLRTLRIESSYLKKRMNKRYYLGRPERIKEGKFLVTSEETPFMLLPLLKYAKDKNSGLFFIERGAYSQKLAINLLKESLSIDAKCWSYKLSCASDDSTTISQELSNLLQGFIRAYFPEKADEKISEEYIKQLGSFSELTDIPISKSMSKLDLLSVLILREKFELLENVRCSVLKNRANRKGSVNYRAKYCSEIINLREEDFGDNSSDYSQEILKFLKNIFPAGVTKGNEREFFNEFNNFNRKYLKENFGKVSFSTLPFVKLIARSLGISLGNVIYCDDGIATGLSYFMSMLFHKIVSDSKFQFSIYTHMNEKIMIEEVQITSDSDFYEDLPETTDFYYLKGERVFYKHEEISEVEQKRYALFLKELMEVCEYSLIKEMLLIGEKYVYPYLVKSTGKKERSIAMILFLLSPDSINEGVLRLFGHNPLVNYLENVQERQQELGIEKILYPLKRKYLEIKRSHIQQVINLRISSHKKYLEKIGKFREFFRVFETEVRHYFDSESADSKILTDNEHFLELAKKFYDWVDSPENMKEIPEGY